MAQQQQQIKPAPLSKLQVVINHLHDAHLHMGDAMTMLSKMIMDLQKGDDFITGYRDMMIKAVEDNGGDVEQTVEAQIREFVPKQYRRTETEHVEESK